LVRAAGLNDCMRPPPLAGGGINLVAFEPADIDAGMSDIVGADDGITLFCAGLHAGGRGGGVERAADGDEPEKGARDHDESRSNRAAVSSRLVRTYSS